MNIEQFSKQVGHSHVRRKIAKNCVYCTFRGVPYRTKWLCKGCNRHMCRQKKGITCYDRIHKLPSMFQYFRRKPKSPGDPMINGHILSLSCIVYQCHICKKFTKQECVKCNLHFCFPGTGRECFKLHHTCSQNSSKLSGNMTPVEEPEEITVHATSSSNDVDKDISDYVPNGDAIGNDTSEMKFSQRKAKCQRKLNVKFSQRKLSGNMTTVEKPDEITVHATSSSNDVDKGISHSVPNGGAIDNDTSEIENQPKANHIPSLGKYTKPCFYCKTKGEPERTLYRCEACCLSLCNQPDGKNCFQMYHSAFKDVAVSQSEKTASTTECMPITNHTLVAFKTTKLCFHCKAEKTYWRCEACSKPFCNQETGKTCYQVFHSEGKWLNLSVKSKKKSKSKAKQLAVKLPYKKSCKSKKPA